MLRIASTWYHPRFKTQSWVCYTPITLNIPCWTITFWNNAQKHKQPLRKVIIKLNHKKLNYKINFSNKKLTQKPINWIKFIFISESQETNEGEDWG